MLRKFKIKVDGTEYLVEMEEVGAAPTPADLAAAPAPAPVAAPAVPAAPAPAPAPAPEPAAPAPAPAAVPGEGNVQTAPMPGKVLDIDVAPGTKVHANQRVLVLEAMKMENEIVAEMDGTITAIHVNKGDMVNPGSPLFTIG